MGEISLEEKPTYSRVEQRKRKRNQAKKRWTLAAVIFVGIVIVTSALWANRGGNHDKADQVVNDNNHQQNEHIGQTDDPDLDWDLAPDSDPDSNVEPDLDPNENELNQPDEPTNAQPEETGSETIKLTFVGDVLLGSTVDNLLTDHGYDYPYSEVLDEFLESDLLAANLETPITERGEPEDKLFTYRSKPEVLPAFKEAGFDIVTLANNHILDYWHEGLFDTLSFLDEHGIARVGAGKDETEAYEPVILEVDGVSIAYVGLSRVVPRNEWKATPYHPGVAESYSLERSVATIERAKEEADLVVVLVHWGTERESEPNEHQLTNAHAYIDAGADLVVGSHPHVLQGFEKYKGKWIAYSLGNFIFTTNAEHEQTWEGGILHATCTPDGDCEIELVPVWNKWAKPTPMDDADRHRVFKRLESEKVKIDQGEVYERDE